MPWFTSHFCGCMQMPPAQGKQKTNNKTSSQQITFRRYAMPQNNDLYAIMDELNMNKVEKHTTSPSSSSPFREVMNSLLGRRDWIMLCRDRLFSGASMSPMIPPMKLLPESSSQRCFYSPLWDSYCSQIGITVHGVETEIMTVRKRSTQKSNICIPEIWRLLISEERMWAIHLSQDEESAVKIAIRATTAQLPSARLRFNLVGLGSVRLQAPFNHSKSFLKLLNFS